jgi:hypothetical protein
MTRPSMYRAIMGHEAFDRLAAPIQQFHSFAGHHEFDGMVEVHAPSSPMAKLLAMLLGSPSQAAQGVIHFDLQAQPNTETWTRLFPGCTMRSTLTQSDHFIIERLGAATLFFTLIEVDGSLEMRLQKMYFLGIACPKWLRPTIIAKETAKDQQLHFQIEANVPMVGCVARYSGYIVIA